MKKRVGLKVLKTIFNLVAIALPVWLSAAGAQVTPWTENALIAL